MIYKSHNHAYYKIEDGLLYEAYTTICGPRFRTIGRLKYPDRKRVPPEEINLVEQALREWGNV